MAKPDPITFDGSLSPKDVILTYHHEGNCNPNSRRFLELEETYNVTLVSSMKKLTSALANPNFLWAKRLAKRMSGYLSMKHKLVTSITYIHFLQKL